MGKVTENKNYKVHLLGKKLNIDGFKVNQPKCSNKISIGSFTCSLNIADVTCKACLSKIKSLQSSQKGLKILAEMGVK